ncbi:MAG TPA: hypothetical protein VG406_03620 [Isosphaeraceae bacterium]|nr:hypothetical protein [Isosphaeraceae bacterium]
MTANPPPPSQTVRLGALAHARSGDKGDRANIGVVADNDRCYDWLDRHLSAAAVAGFLGPMGVGEVVRYPLPKIRAFNFVIERALAGGASRSLRLDTQGKAIGVALLELEVPAPPWLGVGGEPS